MYGSMENVRIITLAPELNNAVEVIEELTERGITVSLGKLMFLKDQGPFSVAFCYYILNLMKNSPPL
jgi:N-acetylglucosamine-6-phosphate deacetylase